MKRMVILFLLIFIFKPFDSFGQTPLIDSLKFELKKGLHDTLKCAILNTLIELEPNDTIWPKYNSELMRTSQLALNKKSNSLEEKNKFNYFLAEALHNEAYLLIVSENYSDAIKKLKTSSKYYLLSGNPLGEASNMTEIGTCYVRLGEIDSAILYFQSAYKTQINSGAFERAGISMSNIGYTYQMRGNFKEALIAYNKSLDISRKLKDSLNIANTLNNIGTIYLDLKEGKVGLKYLLESYEISNRIGAINIAADNLNNISTVYSELNELKKANEYLSKSLDLFTKINSKRGMATCYGNFGDNFIKSGNIELALKYLNKALLLSEEIGDIHGKSSFLGNIGTAYYKLKDFKKAIFYFNQSKELANKLGFINQQAVATNNLFEIYKHLNNHKLALENFELYIKMRDSLNNIETQKATIKQQTQYEYDKQKALDDKQHEMDIKQNEEKALAEKNKQNIIIASVSIVLILVVVFSVFLYNRFKITQKQKLLIEQKEKETHFQKEIIQEKHKEITDSINYAERIQRSFLATKELLDENLNTSNNESTNLSENQNYFIFFKPKDVVSGDFYWASKLNNGNFAFVTADSTGHGVPGAIMSLLNITSLEKAIELSSDPAEILNNTRKTIIERLKKDGSAEGGKDGMDCSLLSFNFKTKELQVAAANNPVWIVGNNELTEIKPDKMPVGKHDNDKESFTTHTVKLQSGDIIYALTDGFPDQFGGERGKKFMSKKLKELLQTNAHLTMKEQLQLLETTFNNWVGDLEQIDDVTLVGIKV